METPSSDLVVNQISTFVCRGTIRKEGPFSVEWYLVTPPTIRRLQAEPIKIIGQNECSRSISRSLNYNVSETDGPNLFLECLIDSGQGVRKTWNFTIQGKVHFSVYVCFQISIRYLHFNQNYTKKN